MNNLSKQIKKRREALGMDKATLARKVGVSDVTLIYWESGQIKQIGHIRLLSLASSLECTVSELLEDTLLPDLKRKWQAQSLREAGSWLRYDFEGQWCLEDVEDFLAKKAKDFD
jgi:transcriptional regulator with XRE-family HTH domain